MDDKTPNFETRRLPLDPMKKSSERLKKAKDIHKKWFMENELHNYHRELSEDQVHKVIESHWKRIVETDFNFYIYFIRKVS